MQLNQIAPEDFERLQGSAVTLRQQSVSVSAVVAEVRRLPRHDLRATEPFAVILRGPHSPVIPQGMVAIEHPEDADLAVFMVPIGPDAAGMRYEVTFN